MPEVLTRRLGASRNEVQEAQTAAVFAHPQARRESGVASTWPASCRRGGGLAQAARTAAPGLPREPDAHAFPALSANSISPDSS